MPRLRAPGGDQLTGAEPGQRSALARQVWLVGVTRLVRCPREIGRSVAGYSASEQSPQSQHPLKRLRPVADRRLESTAQLAFAEAKLGSEQVDPLATVTQSHDGRLHRRVGWPLRDEPRDHRHQQFERVAGTGVVLELQVTVELQLRQRDALVAYLAERYS